MRHADFCRLCEDSVQTVRRQRANSVQIRVDLQIYTNLHRGFQICIHLHEIYTKSTRICRSLSLTKQAAREDALHRVIRDMYMSSEMCVRCLEAD